MQAVKTFNQMMACFFEELQRVYPSMQTLKVAQDRFAAACKARPEAPMRIFGDAIGPYMAKLQACDDTFLTEDLPSQPWFHCTQADIDLIRATSADNKAEIFNWLTQLAFMAIGVTNLPADGLQMVDRVMDALNEADGGTGRIAEQLAAAMNGQGTFDLQAVLGIVGGLDAIPPA